MLRDRKPQIVTLLMIQWHRKGDFNMYFYSNDSEEPNEEFL